MIWFLIKKNFFDGWENIINLVVPNLVCDVFVLTVFFGYRFFRFPFSIASLVIIFTGLTLLFVAAGAFGKNAFSIASFESAHVSSYFKNIGQAFKDYLKFGMITALVILSGVTGVPLYIGINGFVGFMLAMILFVFVLIMLLGLQWFIPLKEILKLDFKKTFKKCFVILFDNFAFSIFMFVYAAFLLTVSVFLCLFMPGFSGIVLAYVNALRLRLYKYDWLDQHSDLKNAQARKNIPWEALIKEDSDMLGKKSIKSLFKPYAGDHED